MCKGPEVPRTEMVPHCSYSKIRTPEQACTATLPLAPACVSNVTAPNFSFPFSCFSATQILFLLLKNAQLVLASVPMCFLFSLLGMPFPQLLSDPSNPNSGSPPRRGLPWSPYWKTSVLCYLNPCLFLFSKLISICHYLL